LEAWTIATFRIGAAIVWYDPDVHDGRRRRVASDLDPCGPP
jgi:hypothetical protein